MPTAMNKIAETIKTVRRAACLAVIFGNSFDGAGQSSLGQPPHQSRAISLAHPVAAQGDGAQLHPKKVTRN